MNTFVFDLWYQNKNFISQCTCTVQDLNKITQNTKNLTIEIFVLLMKLITNS